MDDIETMLQIDPHPQGNLTNGLEPSLKRESHLMEATLQMMASPAPSPNDFRTGPLLKGHSLIYNNIGVILVYTVVIVLPLLGWVLDRRKLRPFKNRPHTFRGTLVLVAAYVAWIPAIFSWDFCANIGFIVPIIGTRYQANKRDLRESTRSFIKLLWEQDARLGAVILAFYAFAIPVAKLVLLAVAESTRYSPTQRGRQISRGAVFTMQAISKWAAPDMFGFVLLYYLFRAIAKPPVDVLVVFDIGFTCYGTFILIASIGAMYVPMPRPWLDMEEEETEESFFTRKIGHRNMYWVMLLCLAAWIPLMVIGLSNPCFELSLDASKMKIPDAAKEILATIRLEDMVPRQQVTIFAAARGHLRWFRSDLDLNLLLAFVMILFFGIIFTISHMLLMVMTAWNLRHADHGEDPPWAWKITHHTQHFAMLDVALMGVVVCVLTLGSFNSYGVNLRIISTGFFTLLAAEVIRHTCYRVLEYMVEDHFLPLEEEREKGWNSEKMVWNSESTVHAKRTSGASFTSDADSMK